MGTRKHGRRGSSFFLLFVGLVYKCVSVRKQGVYFGLFHFSFSFISGEGR